MRLSAYPGESCPFIYDFMAKASAAPRGAIALRYRLHADLAQLVLPVPVAAARADELWRRTCMEAFLGRAGESGYHEFNFSPSGQWAAYRFSDYRSGMEPIPLRAAPAARWRTGTDRLELHVLLPSDCLPAAQSGRGLRLGLAAVIEARSGTITHWALSHGAGGPDFHRAASFVLELPADVEAGTGRQR